MTSETMNDIELMGLSRGRDEKEMQGKTPEINITKFNPTRGYTSFFLKKWEVCNFLLLFNNYT